MSAFGGKADMAKRTCQLADRMSAFDVLVWTEPVLSRGVAMRRRDFVKVIGGGAAAWPLVARAQQLTMPVVAFIRDGSAESNARWLAGFQKGLSETGYVEGQNVAVEYNWLEGKYDRLPALVADLVRRQVAVIAALGTPPAQAAKAATVTIPIVFLAGEDPVGLGLVDSMAKPGGNLTGVNIQTSEVVTKRLRLLHDLLPNAVRIAVLVDPGNASVTKTTVQEVQKAAPTMGLQTQIINATTVGQINEVFAAFERERPDALFVPPDAFLTSRRVQLATLTARDRIPATYPIRDYVEVGGLMSYGPDFTDMFRQVGVYTGRILKGAKPAELPVLQSNKFDLVINLSTAKALGLTIPPGVMAIADEVIE
jgi:putative tryptophan/tyrosine transport system substrate-binding protein